MTDINMYLQSNSILAVLSAYISGVLVSLTPCVYPLIPVTIGIIGAKSAGQSKLRAFFISFIYVLGMVLTYAVLGAVASLTGRIFGTLTINPYMYLVIGNIFLLLALNMLDVFSLPSFLNFNQPEFKKTGLISIFVLGIISGLVVGPCTAPVLGAILVFVATKQNIVYGITLLISFAFGIGTLFLVLGTFTGVILPKSGVWMVKIKKIFGWIMLLAAEYFLIQSGKLF